MIAFGLLGFLVGRSSLPPKPVRPAYVKHLVIEDPYATVGTGATWRRGDVHLASVRSLGKDLPRELGEYYRSRGFAFLGVTDVNTYTWITEYARGRMAGIAGVEASYPFADLLALNMDHWLPAHDLQAAVDWIREDEGLAVLAAPNSREKPVAARDVLALHDLFGLEVYDARLSALDPAQGDATALWDSLLSRGRHLFAFAGDDLRSLKETTAGSAWIAVLAPANETSVLLSSLRQGAFYASTGPAFISFSVHDRTIIVDAPPSLTLRFIGSGGRLLAAAVGGTGSYAVKGDEGYVRVEAIADNGSRAWSQPFYLVWA